MVKVKGSSKKTRPQNDFYEWLCGYLEKNGATDPVGDIAAEVQRDYIFPRGNEKTLDDFKDHLTSNYKPLPQAITALEMAYEMYLRQ
jgi:hypothetical protein